MSLHPGFSRRDFCKSLGLLGATILLGGCESLPRFPLSPGDPAPGSTSAITPDQFKAKVGTVEAARSQAARGIETPGEFIQRFMANSPRVQVASRSGGPIGSVLYNPKPVTIASAVKLQLARGKGEPELLHNDLGEMAAIQYAQFGPRVFVGVFPNSVSIVGDSIHKNRSLLQLVINGNLPSEKIVCTNEDLENLIGRQLTFAAQMVDGIRCGSKLPSLNNTAIWTTDGTQPEGTVSLPLAGALIRLEVAGEAVRTITPENPARRPAGWQDVSESYRNFAVGQLIEAEQSVRQHVPRNSFEKKIVAGVLGEYGPYLDEIKRRLDWGHTCVKTYSEQKQDGRADLLLQPMFVHREAARKSL